MGKNKKSGTQTMPPVVKEKLDITKVTEVSADTKNTTSLDKPKTDLKEKAVPPVSNSKKEEADGKIEDSTVIVEESPSTNNAKDSAMVFTSAETRAYLANLTEISPAMCMDSNHVVTLLQVATERFRGADKTNPQVIATNDMLDDLTLHAIVIAGISMRVEGKKMGLRIPVEALDSYVRAFGYFDITLPTDKATLVPGKPSQIEIPFEGVSEAANKVAKSEIVSQKSAIPELDPHKWKNDEDAQKALGYIMADVTNEENRFVKCMDKLREYKIFSAKEATEKKMWKDASKGTIFDTLLNNLGDTTSALINGVGGHVYSSIVSLKSPIHAHLVIKARIPNCSDSDVRDIVTAFVRFKAKHNNPAAPIENNLAYIGLASGTKNECLVYPARVTNNDKKLMMRIQNLYATSLGLPTDVDYALKATNLLLSIINLYKTDNLCCPCTSSGYAEAVEEALKATNTTHVEPKTEEKPAEVPAAPETPVETK